MPLLAACASPPGLDRLGPFTLELWDDMRDNVIGHLSYNTTQLGCLTLADDFTGDMNGRAPVAVDTGGSVASTSCRMPIVEVPRPIGAAERATLTITSGEDRVVAEIDGLQWPTSADEQVDGADQTETIPLVATTGAGVLQVRLSGALPPGTAHVHALAARQPVIASCEGANTCEWLSTNVVMVTLDVAFDVSS